MGAWEWKCVPGSEGFWEPRTLPIHQPWPGRRCSGEVFSPEDWAPQQAGCSEHKRGRFPGPTEGVRERTGRQELRVRAKGKEGPAGPASVSQRTMIGVWMSLLRSEPWGYSYESRRQRTDLGEFGKTDPNEKG